MYQILKMVIFARFGVDSVMVLIYNKLFLAIVLKTAYY